VAISADGRLVRTRAVAFARHIASRPELAHARKRHRSDRPPADLQSPLALAALRDIGVSAADDDNGPCPAIARAGEQLGWQAVRARSAANPDGTALGIFHDGFPPREHWHIEADATRPSVRTAYLTRYRAGERPAWLDKAP
jgi:hypothetical protein